MTELGITLNFSTLQIEWDGATVPMQNAEFLSTDDMLIMYNKIFESDVVLEATSRLKAILDAKCKKRH